jgi:ribosomal protein L37AE/L43A
MQHCREGEELSVISLRSSPRAWLLLAVGDDRQHGGNEGYDDDPATRYSWDSTVPNHGALQRGDRLAVWDKRQLLGASVIEDIERGSGTKTLYTCPYCSRATIKARTTLSPLYKCYSCKEVFDEPRTREVEVATYSSRHGIAWVDLSGTLPGAELRALCVKPKSQLSLRPLRWDAFAARLGRDPVAP